MWPGEGEGLGDLLMETWKKCAATGERRGMEVVGVGGCDGGEGERTVDGEQGREGEVQDGGELDI